MFNPIEASKNIKEEFISYISTSFSFADNELRHQFEDLLNDTVSKGPYLETNDVFVSGNSIIDLINENVLSPEFKNLELKSENARRLPLSRPLYKHQENAMRSIASGNNVVISTGTGSGKTNCFLIPVINELLREKEAGTLDPGIRALFIYPMNALANDQLKNIRKILMDYEDITFGVYNGGTENDEEDAIKVYESMFANEPNEKLQHPLKNELLSREKMKETPPNILFTNYAMLEHLLFRPKDDVLFTKSKFKFVVLDEAHIYSGATGIETSILLRRLRARISQSNPQFILTSATLGADEGSNNDILKFASNLCGAEFKEENIIRSAREHYVYSPDGISYPLDLIRELADEENKVAYILDKYNIKHEDLPENELIYDFIKSSALYHKFRSNVEKITSLEEIVDTLGMSNKNDCIAFISLCARATKNGKALLDARYHFFIRGLEGCFIAFSPEKRIFLNRRRTYNDTNDDYCVFEIAICNDCGRFAIVGKEQDGKLVQASQYDKEVNYYCLAEEINNDIEDDDIEDDENTIESEDEVYYLCPHCGTLIHSSLIKVKSCDCSNKNLIKVIKVKRPNNDTSLGLPKCRNCRTGKYNRFYLGNDAATSVLATSLYEELPEVVFKEEAAESEKRISIGGFEQVSKSDKKTFKVSTGRQFLAFSDSRQEAAKFACYLGKSYDEFLRRRGICHIIEKNRNRFIGEVITMSNIVELLTSFFSNNRCFASSNFDKNNLTIVSQRNAWVAMLNELARTSSSTSLTALGVLQFEYLGNNDELIRKLATKNNVDYDSMKNLLDLLILEIVRLGAICPNEDTSINDNDREYIFYSSMQKSIAKLHPKSSIVSSWLPRNKKGNLEKYNISKRMYYVMKYLNVSEKQAYEFLEGYFRYLTEKTFGNDYLMKPLNDGTFVLRAEDFRVRVYGDQEIKWYKCKKCGRVSPYHIRGKCVSPKCNGDVIEEDPEKLRENNHFSKLYFSDRMSPLFIKEHTAQLSKRESANYQEQFIKKEINALSCSTTFEMGVDVGDLETVFLRDVPPLPSNYAQRAGRAGRSIDAAAYCLTYAKLSSHDLSFFKEPEKMINGIIRPPLFKVDNEKIVRRHIYAVALSMYFSIKPDQYNSNSAEKFINNKGYKDFLSWLDSRPEQLKVLLQKSIPNNENLHERLGINDFSWLEDFSGKEGVFTTLINEYEGNVEKFDSLIKRFYKDMNSKDANKCEIKRKHYMSNRLIEFLARGNILPRYGFPVDTVELEQNVTASNINKLRLARDLSMAIAEYAPSSEVIADGKLYTSRYIKKTNLGENKKDWRTAYIGKCKNDQCQTTNYSVTPIGKEGVKCSSCGELLLSHDFSESIEPVSGFVTDREAKEVPLSRQEKNYKSEDIYIGNKMAKVINKTTFEVNGKIIEIESTTNDSLMVKSYLNFYVCPKCGYAISEEETISGDRSTNAYINNKAPKITTKGKHESLFGQYNCDCQDLVRYSLHHVFNTDVAKINFINCDTSDKTIMLSAMYAILYAISDYLNIERKDIKACLSLKIVNHVANYSIIIYDAVPGGAGHSRRLVANNGITLRNIISTACNNMEFCKCDPSCYNCLRSYENQKIHELLDRKLALNFLKQFEGNLKIIENDKINSN